jgi:hypothetical protein
MVEPNETMVSKDRRLCAARFFIGAGAHRMTANVMASARSMQRDAPRPATGTSAPARSTGTALDHEIAELMLAIEAPEPCQHLQRDLGTEQAGARAYCGTHALFGLRTGRGIIASRVPLPQATFAPGERHFHK